MRKCEFRHTILFFSCMEKLLKKGILSMMFNILFKSFWLIICINSFLSWHSQNQTSTSKEITDKVLKNRGTQLVPVATTYCSGLVYRPSWVVFHTPIYCTMGLLKTTEYPHICYLTKGFH